MFARKKTELPSASTALPGRSKPIATAAEHYLFSRPLKGPYPAGTEQVMFGLGCFWGAERKFWELPKGIWVTAVGYAAGLTPNPTYEEVCSGLTGHNEVVLVVYQPSEISFDALLKVFWECHNPTQGMRQGNDMGTQYRSGIYTTTPAQLEAALASRDAYGRALRESGYGAITTEVMQAPTFYFAEEYLPRVKLRPAGRIVPPRFAGRIKRPEIEATRATSDHWIAMATT
jgi:peptide-methionine (S)-S-oxide reductase